MRGEGDLGTSVAVLTLAPARSSSAATSWKPFMTATCSAVLPNYSAMRRGESKRLLEAAHLVLAVERTPAPQQQPHDGQVSALDSPVQRSEATLCPR